MTDRPDPESSRADEDRRGPPCPFCEAGMDKRHCKYVCPNHGVVYDCSDPFR
ncbi:HVO_2523 family zinc finger protein [Halovivax sp.]|uniref:HVO_2523 family zinc finger protein n=1 Tax=Halovivax sp. TaxID=1935978 RepID=UPI0025BACDDD|nr:HVO_2523 family zinc finger protein [Halovivax sp.]